MWTGGVGLPWNLGLAIGLGIVLMCSRLTLGAQGPVAHVHHLVGSLAVTVAVIACAELARPVRFALPALGIALAVAAVVQSAPFAQTAASLAAGAAFVLLGLPRGAVQSRYGG
jgi:hypothetical protein